MKITDKAKRLVCENLDVAPSKVHDRALFMADLGADSFDLLELMLVFEDEFEIEFGDGDIRPQMTFGDLANLVARKVARWWRFGADGRYCW